MRSDSARNAVERAQANALRVAEEYFDAEFIDPGEPPGDLVLRGRVAMADTSRNPDAYVDEAELDRDLRDAMPPNTVNTLEYQWGRFIWWCGKVGRQHLPAEPNTLRAYIKAHLALRRDPKRPDERLPYALATVENAVYCVSWVHKMFGYLSPVNAKVKLQLDWYAVQCNRLKLTPRKAEALTPAESIRIARVCDQRTVGGLRNATAFRLQFDTGMRASELLDLTFADVRWLSDTRVNLHIAWSKTRKARDVGVQANPDGPTADVDPLLLFRRWYELMRDRGHIAPDSTVFRKVYSTRPRKDGQVSGTVRLDPWPYIDYEAELLRIASLSGVDTEPISGDRRVITSHSNRAGHITAAVDAGIPLDRVGAGTGHSPQSKVIHDYYRSGKRWDEANTGFVIRDRAE